MALSLVRNLVLGLITVTGPGCLDDSSPGGFAPDGSETAGADAEVIGPPPLQCRSQCELAASECVERPFADFPDFETTLRMFGGDECTPESSGLIEGSCGDGGRWLSGMTSIYTAELRHFDAQGAFRGLVTMTDVSDSVCSGQGYWPEVVLCATPIVTRVCGDRGPAVGSAGWVPWADGTPAD